MSGSLRSSGARFLENLAYLVPSREGYRDPARRRDEDARLRSRLIDGLEATRCGLVDFLEAHAASWTPSWVEGIERRIQRIEKLAWAIRYAPYGFSGFFDATDVREETIERVLEADLLLLEELDALDTWIRSSIPASFRIRDYQTFLDSFDQRLSSLERRMIVRDKCLGDR